MTAPSFAERGLDTFPKLLAGARSGDVRAVRVLVDWLSPTVVGYLRGQGTDDPEGAANETFFRAFTHIAGFSGDDQAFRSWIFTIAHNLLIDDRRRRQRRIDVEPKGITESDLGPTVTAGNTEIDAWNRLGERQAIELLGALSPEQRDVLLLRVVADLPIEQTARTLGKSITAVKALQRRGLDALRRHLHATSLAVSSSSTRIPPDIVVVDLDQ